MLPHPHSYLEWGNVYDEVYKIGLVATKCDCLKHVEWFCFKGVAGVLAEEVKQPWRLLEREFDLEEIDESLRIYSLLLISRC